MTTIPLNNEGGIEPHLTFCPRCNGPTDELTLGVLYKAEIPSSPGQYIYTNRNNRSQTTQRLKKEGHIPSHLSLYWIHVPEEEKVPASQLCTTCQTEQEEHLAIVASGGVYFRCVKCNTTGVIRPSPYATAVRESANIEPPNPCGIEFQHCTEHQESPHA